jgi:cytochrome P450
MSVYMPPDILYSSFTDQNQQTAKTLLIFLSTMLIHPNVQRRVHEEIDQEMASGSLPTLDDRSKLPYLDAAWRESRRLNPSSPLGTS